MESEIKCLPYLRLVGETYIFIGAFKDPVRKGFLVEKDFDEKIYPQLILPIESILDDNYFVNSQGILEEREPFCKHCGAKKYSRKGYNWRLLYLDDGTPIRIKVKRYKCKKCKKKFQVEFTEYWGKFCNYSNSSQITTSLQKNLKNSIIYSIIYKHYIIFLTLFQLWVLKWRILNENFCC